MKTKPSKTYPVNFKGRHLRVTIPENPNDQEMLFSAIKDNLSPQAVVAIAAHLQGAQTKNEAVTKEVAWFTQELIKMLGVEQYNAMLEEIGL